MKNFILYLLTIASLTLGLTSCNPNSPKPVAEKFLKGLLHYDYESAKSVSTEETKKMIDLMAQFSAMVPDSVKQNSKKVTVDIKDVQEEGDKATVTYTTSEDKQEKKLNLVKVNKQWLVQYSKLDNMDEPDTEDMSTQPIDDSATPDTSSATPEVNDSAQ